MKQLQTNFSFRKALQGAVSMLLFCIPVTLRADEFPWWYTKLLSYHMPAWLIQMLQHPWTILASSGAFLTLLLIIKAILAIKLGKTKRELAKLRSEHAQALHKIDTMKTVQAHQQTTIAHLSALIAHQSKQITRNN